MIKVDNNLYKYSDTTYLVAIKRKNSLGKLVNIQQYFEANSDNDAINYRNKLYAENHIEIKNKKKQKKNSTNIDKYIYKYGKDYYRIFIQPNKLFPDGYSDYFYMSLKEVKDYRDELISKAKLGKVPTAKYRKMLVKDFKTEFLEKYCYGNLSEVTADGYERMLDGFFIPKFGNFTMQEMENKTDDLQAFVNGLKETPNKTNPNKMISTKYQNSIYNVVNLFFNICKDWNGIERNPMKNIKPPKFKTKTTKIYDLEEMYNVLDKLKDENIRDKYVIAILVCSGVRKGELVGLHVEDFNFENNTITVRHNVVSTKRKGTTYEKETKTENGERVITLPPFVMNIAKVYLKYREELINKFVERYGKDYVPPDNMLLSRFGKIMHPDTPYKIWCDFRDKNALGEVTPHGLRHSWCTAEYHENKYLTEKELAILMGHGVNIKMTQHYTHPKESNLKNSSMIFNKFEEKLNNNNELFINLKFEQVATILSGKVFTSSDEMYDIVKRYYSLNYDPTYKEIPKMLFQLKKILENNNNLYKDITNFILKTPNDWEAIYKGKELFGDSFKIETIHSKEKRKEFKEKLQDTLEITL